MSLSTAERVYEQQVENFLDLLEPMSNPGVWLAGGAARTLITNERVSDYDLFFKSHTECDWTKERLRALGNYSCVFRCPKGELETWKSTKGGPKVQLITKRYYSDAQDLINSFDFTICRFVTEARGTESHPRIVLRSPEDEFDAVNHFLRIWKVEYPVATLNRIQKYLKKGYQPWDGQGFWESVALAVQGIVLTEENSALYVD